jgi:hypothetical protein
MSKYITLQVWSPCCRPAKLGLADWQGYKIYGCLGCGKILPRLDAVRAKQEFRKAMREKLSDVWGFGEGHFTSST